MDAMPIVFEASPEAPYQRKVFWDLTAKVPGNPLRGVFNHKVEMVAGSEQHLLLQHDRGQTLRRGPLSLPPFKIRIVEPKVPLVQYGVDGPEN
jgi:hypothetical protein